MNYKGTIQVWTPTAKKKRGKRNAVELVTSVANLKTQGEGADLYDVLKAERKARNKNSIFVARPSKDKKKIKSERNKGTKSQAHMMMNKGADNPYSCELSKLHRPISEIERSSGEQTWDFPRMALQKQADAAQKKWDSGFRLNDQEIRVLSEVGVIICPKENKTKKAWVNNEKSGFRAGGTLQEIHQVKIDVEFHAKQREDALSKPFQSVEAPTKLIDAALSDEKVDDLSTKQIIEIKRTVTHAVKAKSEKAEAAHMANLLNRRTVRGRGGDVNHKETVMLSMYNKLKDRGLIKICFDEYKRRVEAGEFFSMKRVNK